MPEVVLIEKKAPRKMTQLRPWNESKKRPEIAWEKRIYALSLSTGKVVVLEEEWIPDEDSGEMVRKPGTKPDNNDHYPEMSFKQAVELFDDAEATGDPLTVAFARLYGRSKMTLDGIGELAKLPKYRAVEERRRVVKAKMEEQEAADEIFKAAGIDIPKGLKATSPAELEGIEAQRSLARHVIGGVSQGEIKAPLRGRIARHAVKMGDEGTIEATPG